MKIHKRHKIEKACSKDKIRPGMLQPYLKQQDDGSWELQATDSYVLARIPVEADHTDTEGAITLESLKYKLPARMQERTIQAGNDRIVFGIESGCETSQERPDVSHWPNFDQLCRSVRENQSESVRLSLNAKMLHELAQALGSDVVTLTINTPRSPIGVQPRDNDNKAVGLIMPVAGVTDNGF